MGNPDGAALTVQSCTEMTWLNSLSHLGQMLRSDMSFSILFILPLFLGMGLSYKPFFSRCSLLWWIWAPCSSWNEHRALRGFRRTWLHQMEEKTVWFSATMQIFNITSTMFYKQSWCYHWSVTSKMLSFCSRIDKATAALSSVDKQMLDGWVRITYSLDRVLLRCT